MRPVETTTDRQRIEWRDGLAATVRRSPIANDHTDELVALGAAIDEAREIADHLAVDAPRGESSTVAFSREKQ